MRNLATIIRFSLNSKMQQGFSAESNQQHPLNGRKAGVKSVGQRRQGDQQGALVETNYKLAYADIE